MRSDHEAAVEALRRATVPREKHRRKQLVFRTITAFAVAFTLSILAAVVIWRLSANMGDNPATGPGGVPLMGSTKTGGYILEAIIAFTLGAAAMFYSVRLKERAEANQGGLTDGERK